MTEPVGTRSRPVARFYPFLPSFCLAQGLSYLPKYLPEYRLFKCPLFKSRRILLSRALDAWANLRQPSARDRSP